ncbi:MAG: hypothetical protein DRO06_04720 [Thermoproteota archaeon]|nr:MAG: hypothetical protein DRO06_04720 [Candidatus Korarchaeota archaeon]
MVAALALLILALASSVGAAYGQASVKFVVFGSLGCSACSQLKETLESSFGPGSIVFLEIQGNSTNAALMDRVYELAFPDLPILERVIPLTCVLCNGDLAAVVCSNYDAPAEFWCSLAPPPVAVYPDGRRREISPEAASEIVSLISGSVGASVRHVELAAILAAAAADSVNPCTFSVFSALLLLASSLSRRRAVRTGLSFIAAVYAAYFALGLGLIRVFSELWWLKYAVAAAGIAVGSYEVVSSLGGEFRSPIPAPLKRATERIIDLASGAASVPTAFGAGLLVSVTLLPCSSGPYLVALSIMAEMPSAVRLALLALYNAIFVAPLFGILGLVTLLGRARQVKRWRSKRLNVMNLAAGSLLIAICMIVIFVS